MKFQVSAVVTVSCFTEVEADTKEEAIKIAMERSMAEVHVDGSYPLDETWHIDVDGEPRDAYAEET